jgi:hypothetical protein
LADVERARAVVHDVAELRSGTLTIALSILLPPIRFRASAAGFIGSSRA